MFLSAVSCLNVFGVIYGQELEGVDDDQDPADVRVNLLLPKASAQVLQQSPLVQIGQRAEIVDVRRLREESALHHPPPLLRHAQPHLQVPVADGSVQVFLAQQKAVILLRPAGSPAPCAATASCAARDSRTGSGSHSSPPNSLTSAST